MALKECENGHIYDSDTHDACPYCNGGIYRVDFGSGNMETKPDFSPEKEGLYSPETDDIVKTVLLDEDENTTNTGADDIGKTVLLEDEAQEFAGDDISFASRLVCTDGPDRGREFILRAGEEIELKNGRYVFKP